MNDLIFFNGEIVPRKDAFISPLSSSCQFGLNVFEGIRAYRNVGEGGSIFRLNDHIRRLETSLKVMGLKTSYNLDHAKRDILSVISSNNFTESDLSIRLTLFSKTDGSWMNHECDGVFIAIVPRQQKYAPSSLSVMISSFKRIQNSLIPEVKCGANYINSRYALLLAKNCGFDTAIFMNEQGLISESVGSCVFIEKNGILFTPPTNASILHSITRETVISAAKYSGIEVVEKELTRYDLYSADCAFLVGSAAEVTNISNIDGFQIDGHKKTSNWFKIYMEVVRKKMELDSNWYESY